MKTSAARLAAKPSKYNIAPDQAYPFAPGFGSFPEQISESLPGVSVLASLGPVYGALFSVCRTPAMSAAPTAAERLESLTADALTALRGALAQHTPAVLTTSLGMEDMVLLDLIATAGLDVTVVTLDTGRLPEATHTLLDQARARYRHPITAVFPNAAALQEFVAREGTNPFYRSVALRQACCAVRKLEPLTRALNGMALWITGLRRAQSVTRTSAHLLERDAERGIMKLSPLIDWTLDDVRTYVAAHRVPINALHDQGFPSIGCAPCTRAVAPGEDERAGRWWWETPASRECGLHVSSDGRVLRTRTAS